MFDDSRTGGRVLQVLEDGPAHRAGLRCGDRLLAIDGEAVRDVLDVMWALQDGEARLIVDRQGEILELDLFMEEGEALGLTFENELFDGLKRCPNRCVFCFVDQQPGGLRRSLYVKDEDYRASFLHGNFITMTNLDDDDLDRIVRMRLSPLYVSVHAADETVRNRLLGRADRPAPPILPLLDELGRGGIRFYAQVVVVPGWNDGAVLRHTLGELSSRHPVIIGTAVVPVGLTGHRKGLPELAPVDEAEARKIVDAVGRTRESAIERIGSGLAYGADELFLAAGLPFPPPEYYDDFAMLENGVGMCRRFLVELEEAMADGPGGRATVPDDADGHGSARRPWRFPAPGAKHRPERVQGLVVVTGLSAASFFERQVIPELENTFPRFDASRVRVLPVDNTLLGHGVTVAGLLPGRDILEAVRSFTPPWPKSHTVYAFCDHALDEEDRIFLDDMSLEELGNAAGVALIPVPDDGAAFVDLLENLGLLGSDHSRRP